MGKALAAQRSVGLPVKESENVPGNKKLKDVGIEKQKSKHSVMEKKSRLGRKKYDIRKKEKHMV